MVVKNLYDEPYSKAQLFLRVNMLFINIETNKISSVLNVFNSSGLTNSLHFTGTDVESRTLIAANNHVQNILLAV